MSELKAKIKQKLDEARAHVNAVLDQVGDRWQHEVYSDGLKWTVRDIVAHLADTDAGHNGMVANIAEGKDLIPADFDLERYNASRTEKNASRTVEELRQALANSRQALYVWLDAVDEAKLFNEGRHASLRIMSVKDILRLMSLHERMHIDDIAKVLDITV